MTREEMIAKLEAHDQGAQEPTSAPTREEMIAKLEAHDQASAEPTFKDRLVQALGYAGGVTRTAAASGAGLLSGQDVGNREDWKQAFGGNAPSGPAYLKRLGWEKSETPQAYDLSNQTPAVQQEWNKFQTGAMAPTSPREKVGRALQLALDPITYAGSPVTRGTKALAATRGESMWRKGLEPLDAAAEKMGKGPNAVSDVAIESNIARGPTARANMEQLGQKTADLYDQQQTLLNQADLKGAKVSGSEVVEPLLKQAEKYEKLSDPGAQDYAKMLRTKAEAIQGELGARPEIQTTRSRTSPILGPDGQNIVTDVTDITPAKEAVGPSELSQIKTFWGKDIPQGKWAEYAKTDLGNEAKQAQYLGAKNATENAVESVLPEGGQALKKTNQDLGALLSTRKKQLNEVGKNEAKELFTSVDAPMLGYELAQRALEAGSGNPLGIALLAKKLRDVLKLQGPRTYMGSRLYNFGTGRVPPPPIGGLEPALRYNFIQQNQPPWQRLLDKKENSQ